jgi:DNA-binding transcriptional ArsR family regulator
MKPKKAIASLAALAQETRLAIFRALVRAGHEGLAAGAIAEAVGTPASTLSFHLKELSAAGLVRSRQEGRFVYYSAEYDAMSELVAFLTESCCQGMAANQAARIDAAVAACCGGDNLEKRRRIS